MFIKYENFINDIENKTNKVLNFLEIEENRKFSVVTKPANKYLSSLDYFEKYLFTAFYKEILNKEDLDIISNNDIIKKYIQFFDYPAYLYENDIVHGLDTKFWNGRKIIIKGKFYGNS